MSSNAKPSLSEEVENIIVYTHNFLKLFHSWFLLKISIIKERYQFCSNFFSFFGILAKTNIEATTYTDFKGHITLHNIHPRQTGSMSGTSTLGELLHVKSFVNPPETQEVVLSTNLSMQTNRLVTPKWPKSKSQSDWV